MYKSLLPFLIFAALITGSCRGGAYASLQEIEGFIQDDPVRAYKELSEIDKGTLRTAREKALYFLLISAALDKNYIDLQSDSLIAPAVRYYSRRPEKYHRFLARYYEGRVYENAGEYDKAMDSYLKADEAARGRSVPDEYKVRLSFAKGRVYVRQFANDRALEESLKAMTLSRNLENPQFYIRSALDAAGGYHILKKDEEAGACLDTLSFWLASKGLGIPAEYYSTRLRLEVTKPEPCKDSLDILFGKYLEACSGQGRAPDAFLNVHAKLALGLYREAKEDLDRIQSPGVSQSFTSADYYYLLSKAEESLGLYKEALTDLKNYQTSVENINLTVFNNDVRFLEERFEDERSKERTKRGLILASLAIAALLSALAFAIVRYRKRKAEYDRSLQEARSEYDYIKSMLSNGKESSPEYEDLLQSRLRALKPHLESYGLKSRRRPSNRDAAKLADERRNMLEAIALMCALTHPGFTSVLAGRGLSAEEIGVCALYVSDYRPKELPDIIGKSSIYHRNTEIRDKLEDLVQGTTLPVWLRQLYRERG